MDMELKNGIRNQVGILQGILEDIVYRAFMNEKELTIYATQLRCIDNALGFISADIEEQYNLNLLNEYQEDIFRYSILLNDINKRI